MLFLIGLELEPERLWSMRRVGLRRRRAADARLRRRRWRRRASPSGCPGRRALVAGLALALSSTAIAVQTMRERDLLSAPHRARPRSRSCCSRTSPRFRSSRWCRCSRRSRATAGRDSGDGRAARRGRVVGAVALVVVVGRYLTRPLLRIVARTGLREVFTAFALLLVVGIAQLMAAAGVSMALGAFLAGVLLAELGVPARARDRHRAVQGPADGPVLHRGRHVDRLRPARAAGRC